MKVSGIITPGIRSIRGADFPYSGRQLELLRKIDPNEEQNMPFEATDQNDLQKVRKKLCPSAIYGINRCPEQ